MTSRTVKVTVLSDGSMSALPVPFDPKEVFGKVRAPVKVTLNGHTFRSTLASMGGVALVPLRRSNREAAGVEGGQLVEVTFELDDEKREVKPPADLVKALKASPPAWERWRELSFTHQREYADAVEEAKKAETRARRIESAVRAIATRPPRKGR